MYFSPLFDTTYKRGPLAFVASWLHLSSLVIQRNLYVGLWILAKNAWFWNISNKRCNNSDNMTKMYEYNYCFSVHYVSIRMQFHWSVFNLMMTLREYPFLFFGNNCNVINAALKSEVCLNVTQSCMSSAHVSCVSEFKDTYFIIHY